MWIGSGECENIMQSNLFHIIMEKKVVNEMTPAYYIPFLPIDRLKCYTPDLKLETQKMNYI